MILGIGGLATTGKTTSAVYLHDTYGFENFNFSDLLKEIAYKCGWNGEKDEYGRKMLQELGDELRRIFGDDVFINHTTKRIKQHQEICKRNNLEALVTVSDVRLLDEIDALKDLGASVILIEREVEKLNHKTEKINEMKDHFNFVIDNNGTFEELYKSLDTIMQGKICQS